MMRYFLKDDERQISLEIAFVVRDVNGFTIGYGGSIATAIMDADHLEYDEARLIEKDLINGTRERRY